MPRKISKTFYLLQHPKKAQSLRLATVSYPESMKLGSTIAIGKGVIIENHIQKDSPFSVMLGEHTIIRPFTILQTDGGFITIGDDVYINAHCMFMSEGGINIGNNTMIGPFSVFIASSHNFEHKDILIQNHAHYTPHGISIGKDVWIGAHCTILDGVTIGDGAVIGAGSVVKSNIPPYAVAVGSPAIVKKYRT